jgi:hypothetical protein
MSDNFTTINHNAKQALENSKKLIDLTSKILSIENTEVCAKFEFYLPTILTRIQTRASHSYKSIIIVVDNFFVLKYSLQCFIHRLIGKKNSLLIIESKFLCFIIKQKLNTDKQNVCTLDESSQYDLKSYDEVLLFGNYTLDTLLALKDKTNNLSLTTNRVDNIRYFPNNVVFEDDEIYLPAYEIFDFARQFLPDDSTYNNQILLEKCKQKNSGADKPYQFVVDNFQEEIDILFDIFDENITDNITIYLPYGNSAKEYDLTVEKYYKAISKKYNCTKYYDGIELQNICNIIVTTFDAIKYLDFDVVIIPQFQKVLGTITGDTLFEAMCSAKNQLYTIDRKSNG